MSGILTHRRHHVPTSFLLAVVITLTLIVILAVVLPYILVPGTANLPAADRSYDGIEQLRAMRPSAHVAVSLGYDPVETLRIQRNVSPLIANDIYATLEVIRIGRMYDMDRSYDSLETLRLGR